MRRWPRAFASRTRARDRVVLERLARRGADLSQPRHMRAYLYLPSKEAAGAATETLSGEGFEVTVAPATRRSWLALAHREMVVDEDAVADLRDRLEAVAAQHGGTFDCWEAPPRP